MQRILISTVVIATLWASAALADEEILRNDGFESGGTLNFQAGFIAGEVAAARFVPQIACPCVLERVILIFGGANGTEEMGISVWDDVAGNDFPGALLFTGTVSLSGSNNNLQEIDLSLSPVIVDGPFRVGLEYGHSGLPGVATDLDGNIDAGANFILADLGGGNRFWFRSSVLGVSGDFIIRAAVNNFVSADEDGDGIADATDNCTAVANANQQDSDGDGLGNICDADLNNDCFVNSADLGLFRAAFFASDGAPNWNPAADFNSDGVVNPVDLGVLRARFFQPPGPGAAPNVCDPG